MSDTVPAPLTDAEKTDTRRFCGYPAYGAAASGNTGWRFYQTYGALEYRMTNLAAAELVVARQFLATIRSLEAAIPLSGDNLDTSQAAVWTHNPEEIPDRQRLERGWRVRLCAFLGVPPGPGLGAGANVPLVV